MWLNWSTSNIKSNNTYKQAQDLSIYPNPTISYPIWEILFQINTKNKQPSKPFTARFLDGTNLPTTELRACSVLWCSQWWKAQAQRTVEKTIFAVLILGAQTAWTTAHCRLDKGHSPFDHSRWYGWGIIHCKTGLSTPECGYWAIDVSHCPLWIAHTVFISFTLNIY